MTLLTNSFEGGTSGTAITAANSGGTSGNAFDTVTTGGTLSYDNTHAAHGTLAYQNATGGTTVSACCNWSTSLTSSSISQVWYRAYLYYTANPTVQHRIVNALNASTSVGSVLVSTAGKILVTDTAGNIKITSTASIPTNAWFRIEGYFLTSAGGTTGQVELKMFTSSMDGTTADETDTSSANLSNSTAITAIRFGISSNTASVVAHWFDDLGASDTAYVGPVSSGTSANAGLATGTGTAESPDADTQITPPVATGTGTAQSPTVSFAATPSAGLATGAGTAESAGVAAGAVPVLATGTGTAQTPTVSFSTVASANLATAAGDALFTTGTEASVTVTGDSPIQAIGTAFDATVSLIPAVSPNAGLATGTGAAQTPTAAETIPAGAATGTGTAEQAALAVTVNPAAATGTGTARQPVVNTSSSTEAPAGLATGAGTSLAPSLLLTTLAQAQAAQALAAARPPLAQPLAPFTIGVLTASDTALAVLTAADEPIGGTG